MDYGALLGAYHSVDRFSACFALGAGMAFAFTLYEWIIIAQREYKLLFQSQWRWANLLYITCRVLSLVEIGVAIAVTFSGNSAGNFCEVAEYILFINQGLATLAGGTIFLLRLMALWNWNKVILIGMSLLLAAATGSHVWAARDLIRLGPNPLTGVVCTPVFQKKIYGLVYVLDGTFDLIILVLTVLGMKRKHVLHNPRTQELLLQPTIFYYGVVSVWYWVTAAMVFANAGLVTVFFAIFVAVVNPVVACRVFLRLREAGSGPGQYTLARYRFDVGTTDPAASPTHVMTQAGQVRTVQLCNNCSTNLPAPTTTTATTATMTSSESGAMEKGTPSAFSTPSTAVASLPALPSIAQETETEANEKQGSPTTQQ